MVGEAVDDEVFLGREVREERTPGHLRGLRDLGDRYLVEAVLDEQLDGRRRDRLPGPELLPFTQRHGGIVAPGANLHLGYFCTEERSDGRTDRGSRPDRADAGVRAGARWRRRDRPRTAGHTDRADEGRLTAGPHGRGAGPARAARTDPGA